MGCCQSNRPCFIGSPINRVSPAPEDPSRSKNSKKHQIVTLESEGTQTPKRDIFDLYTRGSNALECQTPSKTYRDACTSPLEPFDFGNKNKDDGIHVVRLHQADSSANLKQQGKPLTWEEEKEKRFAKIFSDEPANVANKPSSNMIDPKPSLPGQIEDDDEVTDLAVEFCGTEALKDCNKAKDLTKIDAAEPVASVDAEVVDDSTDCRLLQSTSEEVDNYSNGKGSIAVAEPTEPDVSCEKEEPANMKGDTSHEEDKTGNHTANQVTLQSTSNERTAKEAIMAYEETLMAIDASDATANDTVSETRKVDCNQLEQSKQDEVVDADDAIKESLADYANDNVKEECFPNGKPSLLAEFRTRGLMAASHTQLVDSKQNLPGTSDSTTKPKPRRISIVTLGSILDSDISIITMSRAALVDQEPSKVVESYVPSDVHDEKGIVIDIDGNVINDQPKNEIAAKAKIDDRNNDMTESATVVSFKKDSNFSRSMEQGADNIKGIVAETFSTDLNQNGKAQDLIQEDSIIALTSETVSHQKVNDFDDKNIGIAVDKMLAVSDFPKEDLSVSELIHDLEMLIQNDPQTEINQNVAGTETKATDASVCDFQEPEQAIVSDPLTKPKPTGIDQVDRRASIESSSLLVHAKTPDHGESVELKQVTEEIIQGGKIGDNDLIGKGLIDMPLDRNSATTSAHTAQEPVAKEAIAGQEAVGQKIAKQEVMKQEVVSNQREFEVDQVTPLNSHKIVSKDKFNDLEIGANRKEEATLDKASNESQSPYISDFYPSNEAKVEPLVSLCTTDDRGNYHSVEDVYSDESETVIAMLTCDEADKINHEVEMTYEDVSEHSMGSGISRELEAADTAFTNVAAAFQAATADTSVLEEDRVTPLTSHIISAKHTFNDLHMRADNKEEGCSQKRGNSSDDKNIGIAVDKMLAVSDFPKEDLSVSELINDLEMLIQNDPQIEIKQNTAGIGTTATDAPVYDVQEPEHTMANPNGSRKETNIVSDPLTKPKPTGIDQVDKRAPIESSSLLVDAKTPDHGESVELKQVTEEIIQGGKIGDNDLIGKGLIDMPLDRNSATTSAETAQAPMALEAIAKEAAGKDIAKQEVMEQEVVSNQSVFEADQATPLNSHTIISKDKFNDLEIGADHEEEVTLDKGSNESQSPYISDFCPSNEDKVEPLVSLCTIDDRGNYHSIEDVYSDESETVIAMLTCDEADKINHEVEMTYEDVSEHSRGSGISRELEAADTAFATADTTFTDAATDDAATIKTATIDAASVHDATSNRSATANQPSEEVIQDCSKSKSNLGGI